MALSENDRHDAALHRKQLAASDAWSFAPILRRRIPLIGFVTLAFFVAGLMYVALSVPRYMASGRIMIDRPAAEIASQVSALTSPAALDRVIAREKLETDPQFGGKSKGALSLLLTGLGLASSTDPRASALRQLERAVSVKRDGDSNTANVSALTRDRDVSMRIANAVMDVHVEDQARMQGATVPRANGAGDAQSGTLQARLKEAEQRYEKYRSEAGSAANGVSAGEKQVSVLSDRLAAAEAKADSLRSAVARTRRDGVDPDTIRGRSIDALRNRYAAAKRLQDDLSQTLGPRHPDMIIARLQTSEAKRSLDQAIRDRAEDRMESSAVELERARAAVADLKGRLEVAKKDLGRAKDASVRLRELERDVETNRAAYQAFVTTSREAGERVSMPATKVVSRAALPSDSVGTPRLLVLLTSILLGLAAGVVLALLLELRPEWASSRGFRKSWPFPRS